ncbi:MAG TPA: SPFH domain-containing protein [Bacteroidia bacterium]|jgi:regulator of protease activity HflC (stomatin/prohibitin superfamily)|nr:SPFH domain-containing protein [Bacteroidia bacterium]
MLEWLKGVFEAIWEHLLPFTVIHVYQNAGVLRFGHYHRTLMPGFHWRWPFVEEIYPENIYRTTLALEPQTITTKDDKTVVVGGIVRYRIVDVQPFITEIGNQHDLLRDTSMGAVLRQVRQVELRALLDKPPENVIASDVRRQVKPYGMEIESFTFTDIGQIRTLRLITHTHAPPVMT